MVTFGKIIGDSAILAGHYLVLCPILSITLYITLYITHIVLTNGVTFLEGCLAPWPVVISPSSQSHYLTTVSVQVTIVT